MDWRDEYELRISRGEVIFKWDCSCGRGMDYIYKVGYVFDAKDFVESGWTITALGVRCPVCSKKSY